MKKTYVAVLIFAFCLWPISAMVMPEGAVCSGLAMAVGQNMMTSLNESKPIRIPADYPTIQQGIDAAKEGDTILVADGIYKGAGNKNLDFKGKRIVVASENGAESAIIDCEGIGRGFHFHSGETSESVLRGFTITNSSPLDVYRGAICCINSSPTIEKNIITGNKSSGIYCYNASPTIRDNVISRNSSSYGGGICCVRSSSPVILGNNIYGNNADDEGGGIYAEGSSPRIVSNTIRGNSARRGGGLTVVGLIDRWVTVNSNVIAENSAKGSFGWDNSWGGGIHFHFIMAELHNNLIVNNISDGYGGGLGLTYASHLHIINNTIIGNISQKGGGIAIREYSTVDVINTIIWSNMPREIYLHHTSLMTAIYSDIENGFPGEGNIDTDPLFVDANSGDYRLQNKSPCIDAGFMSDNIPITDIENNPRPSPPGSKPDIGCYENTFGVIEVQITAGWNLISIPVEPTDTAIDKVLESISGHYQSVWAYDSGWKKYIVGAPSGFNDLDAIETGKGYWINMMDDATLTFTGDPITDPTVMLRAGWNLAGYKGKVSKPAQTALSSIADNLISVWEYDKGWKRYIPSAPGNNLDMMEPGFGYWINVTADCIWDVNAVSPAPQKNLFVQGSSLTGTDKPQIPYILYGELLVDGVKAKAGSLPAPDVVLKSDGKVLSSYRFGAVNKYGDFYVLEVPVMDGSKEMELYVQFSDGMTMQAVATVPPGKSGQLIRLDLSVRRVPEVSQLWQNYPNPFNPDTWIPYQLKEDADVEIRIYSLTGQLVCKLDLGHKPAGFYTTKERSAYWDGKNEAGEYVASGVYFYTIQAGNFTATKKMVILR